MGNPANEQERVSPDQMLIPSPHSPHPSNSTKEDMSSRPPIVRDSKSESESSVQINSRDEEQTEASSFSEPILTEATGRGRFRLFPLRYPLAFEMYRKACDLFWIADEVDTSKDLADWVSLTDDERFFIKRVLAFFATSDAVVNENLVLNLYSQIKVQEIRMFYGTQMNIENVHTEVYGKLLDTYVSDEEERDFLFNAAVSMPCVKRKVDWAERWMDSTKTPFCECLIAFACVEGLFFAGSFCAIYWLKQRGLMPGLCFSNELISRDEGMHCDFACLVNSFLLHPASPERILEIVTEAVSIEQEFVRDAIPVELIGMSSNHMCRYIEYCADFLLLALGQKAHYHTPQPFSFMDLIIANGKTNFFERRSSEYKRVGRSSGSSNSGASFLHTFQIDNDF